MKDFNLGEAIIGFFSAYWNLALWVATVAVAGYAVFKLVRGGDDGTVAASPSEAGPTALPPHDDAYVRELAARSAGHDGHPSLARLGL